ncbi:urease subunit gamma [Halococcus sp. PRR34]|uniref:urease subunit gamma n=1 Tax=Halococcus sp. PRR34 TaxID=3020830 RepID=UPI00235DCBC5|nr:urease subunit gamma [Halococcus sp. PRR34]
MNLVPKEQERLTVFMAAELARRRKERGVALNHPEVVAYVSDWVFERARDGWSVAEIRTEAAQLLSTADVMEGVPEMVDTIQVEPVFPDGTKLVTVHDPIRTPDAGDVESDGEGMETADRADPMEADS